MLLIKPSSLGSSDMKSEIPENPSRSNVEASSSHLLEEIATSG